MTDRVAAALAYLHRRAVRAEMKALLAPHPVQASPYRSLAAELEHLAASYR